MSNLIRPLLRPDGLLYRCSHRPEDADTDVASPYELKENIFHTFDLLHPNSHFRVHRNRITILASDASPDTRIPYETKIEEMGGDIVTAKAIPLEKGDKKRDEWLEKIGWCIAAVMFDKKKNDHDGTRFVLADFPAHMRLWRREKTWARGSKKPRTDVYLQVSQTLRFASPFEFARHAMWLMEGKPLTTRGEQTACLCKYCRHAGDSANSAPQELISRDLRILADCPTKRDLAGRTACPSDAAAP